MKRILFLLLMLATTPALGVEPAEMLDDPVLETRAREIGRELRCLVCQNESIEDSNADFARDLRLVVRERLLAGDSDGQVFDYIAARYGDFVLLQPPVKPATWALWFAPAAILIVGGFIAFFYLRGRRTAPGPVPLSAAERDRLDALTGPAEKRDAQ
ncbi:MAG: cytochrome c-type biogenesis protein [Dongiaceae bacterium]